MGTKKEKGHLGRDDRKKKKKGKFGKKGTKKKKKRDFDTLNITNELHPWKYIRFL